MLYGYIPATKAFRGSRSVYNVYRKLCQKLNIPVTKEIIRGPHSFRKNAITYVTNATNGNIIMAASLFGNTPDVSSKNYYLGADLETSKSILDKRNKINIS